MNVRSNFRPWVVRVDGRDCLADAAERMQNEQVGSVVVTIGGRFVGILTERDLRGRSPTGSTPGTPPPAST
jgi:CBS domain-containing protein